MTEKPVIRESKLAAADLRGLEGRLVTTNAQDGLILANASANPVYVLVEGANVGRACTIGLVGIERVIFGGAVPAGASLKPDANGRAVAAVANDRAFGRNIGIAGVNLQVGSVHLESHTA